MGRPSARLFATLLAVAVPPLVAFAAITVYAGPWLSDHGYGAGTQLLVGAAVTALWAGMVAIVAARLMAGEARSMVELARRGTRPLAADHAELSEAQRRLVSTLDERNDAVTHIVSHIGSLTIWGRTGFDGDMSGSRLHAELIASYKTITNSNREQRIRTRSLIDCDAPSPPAHGGGTERHDVS